MTFAFLINSASIIIRVSWRRSNECDSTAVALTCTLLEKWIFHRGRALIIIAFNYKMAVTKDRAWIRDDSYAKLSNASSTQETRYQTERNVRIYIWTNTGNIIPTSLWTHYELRQTRDLIRITFPELRKTTYICDLWVMPYKTKLVNASISLHLPFLYFSRYL